MRIDSAYADTFKLPPLGGTPTPLVPLAPAVKNPPICCKSLCSVAKAACAPFRLPPCRSCASVLNAWEIGLAGCEDDDEVEESCELST